MTQKLSRRDFLKMAGASAASLALASCGVKSTELPASTKTLTPSPTNTLIPTPSSTPEPSPTPEPTLRRVADEKGVKLFNLVLYKAFTDNGYKEMALKSCNGLTVADSIGLAHDAVFKGIDWNDILANWSKYEGMLDKGEVPFDEKLNWTSAEQRIQFAEQNQMEVMAFHLIHGDEISDEIMAATKTKDDFSKIMKFTTKARVLHFKNRIKIWSGPNEIIAHRLYDKGAFMNKVVDNELIHNMFVWLKEADPNTIGLLSESNVVEATSQSPYQRIHDEYFKLLDYLIEKDSPVDGGGLHNHFWVYDPPKPDIVRAVIDEFKKRGKVAYATETTVNLNPVYPLWKDRSKSVDTVTDPLESQAKIFVEMLDVFSSTGNIFGMFGITDAYSWYDEIETFGYAGAGAHLFDKNYQEKPAYKQMLAYLTSLPNQ